MLQSMNSRCNLWKCPAKMVSPDGAAEIWLRQIAAGLISISISRVISNLNQILARNGANHGNDTAQTSNLERLRPSLGKTQYLDTKGTRPRIRTMTVCDNTRLYGQYIRQQKELLVNSPIRCP